MTANEEKIISFGELIIIRTIRLQENNLFDKQNCKVKLQQIQIGFLEAVKGKI